MHMRLVPALVLGLPLVGCSTECHAPLVLAGGSGASATVTVAPLVVETAEEVDVVFDWSAASTDIDCAAFDPYADVDLVGFMRFPLLSGEEVLEGWGQNALVQADTNGFLACEPEPGTARCSTANGWFNGTSYTLVGTWDADGGVFLVTVGTGQAFEHTRLYVVAVPTVGSDVQEVLLDDGCGNVAVEVELEGSEVAGDGDDVCDTGHSGSGGGVWPLDWSQVDADLLGEPLSGERIDEVVVSRYEMTVRELEVAFRDRDSLAAERYVLAVDRQTSCDLADAYDGLLAFDGFDGSGTWTVELRRGSDAWDIPSYLAVIAAG